MTKKDYDLIAACIGVAFRAANNADKVQAIRDVESRLVLEMELDNPRFDLDKFNSRVDYWLKQHGGK